jgi:probable rRNA maturation factor
VSDRDGGLEVHVDVGTCRRADPELIARAVRRALQTRDPSRAEISVALVDDTSIATLNQRFLDERGPTDVLAFALGDEADVVGDVYVGFEQAARQAAELGVPLEEELVRLAVHGTLHVLGHDHPEDADRERSPMFALQERLVRDVMEGSVP